jgi:hypothetical protein
MDNLVEKLSSYNILNNLLPGVIFCYVVTEITDYNLAQKDIVIGLFFYYAVGLIIGRIGSLIVERLLGKVAQKSNYAEFIKASKIDKKLETLSETNNIYRTIVSVIISLFIMKGYNLLETYCSLFVKIRYLLLGVSLLVLFVFSYRKQTKYIVDRVNVALKRGE